MNVDTVLYPDESARFRECPLCQVPSLKKRFFKHVTDCKNRHPELLKTFYQCPSNSSHLVNSELKLRIHLASCNDYLDGLEFHLGPDTTGVKGNLSSPDPYNPPCPGDEGWWDLNEPYDSSWSPGVFEAEETRKKYHAKFIEALFSHPPGTRG